VGAGVDLPALLAVKEVRVDLVVESSTHRGWAVISVQGELDLHSSPALTDEIAGALNQDAPHIAVDLTAVSFMDSTALGVLVASLKRARERDGELTLVGANGSPLKVLTLTGMAEGVFPMTVSIDDLQPR
jgi:anti-sigma B factor antagonist